MLRAEMSLRGGLQSQGVELWGSSILEYAKKGDRKGDIPAGPDGASFLENPVGDAIGELTPAIRADLDEAGIA